MLEYVISYTNQADREKWSRPEQSKHDRARERKWKPRETASEELSKAKEKGSNRSRKKRCIQGESSGDK